jgi:hypothetical protein
MITSFTQQQTTMNQSVGKHAVREFFTTSEWDLIHSLVHNNREFCENDEFDPQSDYDSIIEKIYKLFDEGK